MEEFKGTKGKWKTSFNGIGNFPKGEWVIKADDDISTPIGVIPESLGGIKNEFGRSPKQEANAKLIAAAPELLENLVRILDRIKECEFETSFPSAFRRAQEIIEKAI